MSSVVIAGDTSGTVTLQAPSTAGTTVLTLPATSGTVLTTASTTGISGSAITSGLVAESYGGTGTTTGYYGFKNRIINGAMQIDQRNAGASVTLGSGAVYTVDRFSVYSSQASKLSAQQNAGSVTPPVGFSKYLGLISLSAYSITSTDQFALQQVVEGLNVSDLAWGTANAQTVTLSFYVRSSLTGTFGGVLANGAQNRNCPFTYTISSANTWEQKTVTIAGDTTGTWTTDNTAGIFIKWGLGVGSTLSGTAGSWSGTTYVSATGATSVVGTNGATFYITGVQLEKGTTATSFDYRPYGTELALCQRYLPAFNANGLSMPIGSGMWLSTTTAALFIKLPTTARVAPTGLTSTAASGFTVQNGATGLAATAVTIGGQQSSDYAQINITTTGGTAGGGTIGYSNSTTAQILFTGCEL